MNATSIAINLAGCIVAFVAGWFLFRSVHSDGKRADDTRNQLDAVGEEQRAAHDAVREISSGLADSADTVQGLADAGTDIASAVDAAQSAGVESRQLIDDSRERIAESESIIRGVRERARKDRE